MTKSIYIIAILLLTALGPAKETVPADYTAVNRVPAIRPDYSDCTIPPNIASLNFIIKEDAVQYLVRIYAPNGQSLTVSAANAKITIPLRKWRNLLAENRGEKIYFDIYAEDAAGQWQRFETIENTIANDPADPWLVYRKIRPVYSEAGRTAVYQRDLTSFADSAILDSTKICLNCHSFLNNSPEPMFLGFRSIDYGSSALLATNDSVEKIDAKFGYTAWHPSGRLAAYSLNNVRQFFHAARREVRDVVDLDSTIVYYCLDSKTVKTTPAISRKGRLETFPAWSADGRYLYFSSAPILWEDRQEVPPPNYEKVRYDLLRISYDVENDAWGEPEMVVSAERVGRSILEPRISPDGRWLVFCACDYSCWPAYRPNSDLCVVDLNSPLPRDGYQPRPLTDFNSDQSESWHCFSTNSRWLAFSSKRGTGLFTRVYLGYLDDSGLAHKAFIVPQEDPAYYDSCTWTLGVPELVTAPVRASGEKLAKAIRSSNKTPVDMPITMATPKSGPQQTQAAWPLRE